VRITWLGHSTVVLDGGGARLVTDPVLRSRVAHLRRHAAPPATPGDVDAVLLSHLHHDHLDVPSLRSLGAPVIGPPSTRRALRRLGREVQEVRAGDAVDVASARVVAAPAVHDGRRWPIGAVREDDAIGFVVEAAGERVYFAGDTELFDGMRELAPLDVALVPIWGWGPSTGPGHMDPAEAASAVALLRPRVVVPIHWGTFLPIGRHDALEHLLHQPVEAFLRHAAEAAPDVRVEVVEPGGSLVTRPLRPAG
jgi:L-ascorbate metabolism protein UlaG (beta-lactamase superfamily)